MASPRQLRANRLNALKSTGPKTAEGKERSRENALTHGLAARVVRPLHDHEEVARFVDHFRVSLRPRTNFDEYLLEQVATAAVRIDRCQLHEQDLRERAANRAAAFWDEDRALDAAKIARGLADDPEGVRLRLRQSLHGCRWLIARWVMLVEAIRDGAAWHAAHEALALDLLGVAADLRTGPTPLDRRGADPQALADAELASLRARAERLAPVDALDRERTECGKPVEPDRMMELVRRYEASAARQLRWAARQIQAPRPVQPPAPPVSPRPPQGVMSASEVAGEPDELWLPNEPSGSLGKLNTTSQVAKPMSSVCVGVAPPG